MAKQDFNQTQELSARPSVFTLTQDAARLMLRGSEGFDTDEEMTAWQQEVNDWLDASDDKALACRVVISRFDAEAAYCKQEADRLRDRAKRFEAAGERVTSLVKMLLASKEDAGEGGKVTMADGSTVSLVHTRGVEVQVLDLDAIPQRFCRVKVEADKVALKAAYKAGEQVAGVAFSETVTDSIRWSK